jgi:luciferase family oxidoreductase group 1
MGVTRLGVLHFGVASPHSSSAQQLREFVDAGPAIESMGYSRIWLAEHHETNLSFACPEILTAAIASRTTRIRVGTGGVLLNFYSPLKVAETFRALEALYPGRIDLGLSAGLTADEDARQALAPGFDVQQAFESRLYGRKVDELMAYCRDRFPAGHRFERGPTPLGQQSPPVYLLGTGSGVGNMLLAARWGCAFSYSLAHGDPRPGPEVVRRYRSQFQPVDSLAQPFAILAGNLTCMQTDVAAAEVLCELRRWMPEARANVIGSPARCRGKIESLLQEYNCDEFVLIPLYDCIGNLLRGLALLATEFAL